MKKIVLLALLTLLNAQSFAQNKSRGGAERSTAKTAAHKNTTVVSSPSGTIPLAKVDNLTVVLKNGTFQVSIGDKDDAEAALVIKTVDATFKPLECKLSAFKANGASLYSLTWVEKSTSKTDTKSEDIVSNCTCILEIPTKKVLFSNTETTNHIIEKVFLDKGKNASETQEKLRREGYHCVLNPDGSILLKNKTSEKTLVYDATKVAFVPKKK